MKTGYPIYKPNYFIITGGPGAGKTTLLQELRQLGFICMDEVARDIIKKEMSIDGQAVPWKNRELYLETMFNRSVEDFNRAGSQNTGIIFFDRGILDSITYAEIIGSTISESMEFYSVNYRYNPMVFFLSPWAEIYQTDNERKQDWEEAVSSAERNAAVYKRHNYQLIEVPKVSPQERTQFILEKLSLTSTHSAF